MARVRKRRSAPETIKRAPHRKLEPTDDNAHEENRMEESLLSWLARRSQTEATMARITVVKVQQKRSKEARQP